MLWGCSSSSGASCQSFMERPVDRKIGHFWKEQLEGAIDRRAGSDSSRTATYNQGDTRTVAEILGCSLGSAKRALISRAAKRPIITLEDTQVTKSVDTVTNIHSLHLPAAH
ncbi:hypothetical protein ATANTOWER_024202 [Ataeniobius toweri]|uniref:Uncharacterized protein n=1 Tax=Ataeniobius toweri TaxID=208326 RepID=A0ABU7C415_9TELE|nr:hypothetical protein [Ataeniobius toweri]